MQGTPWPSVPINLENFRDPPREYGILPFWFLNGELDPEEMRYQLREFRAKRMPGIILHGRFGLEVPYIGDTYLERIRYAIAEAEKLGLKTWIYDEMNWPSGTADKRVLQARPDLAQRYIECIHFTVRGPWFTYLTGADSRYMDFERSTPVAAFAQPMDGQSSQVIDLTPYLSFRDVIPWEAPAGTWRLMYVVEKTADYYIDALDPEATREFLRLGYDPYLPTFAGKDAGQMPGFYTDEPAMHYYLTGGDNPIVPWTKDMFRRFQERNGYNLRPRLPDLFFDVAPDSARIRFDFYNTLTDFYSQAYYQQIHEWCRDHDVLFTGHLLYEEWLRKMIRVEGNLFKHYAHMDVIGVDHLYPITGNRDRPDEHVAIKVSSSAAHQFGSPRLLCESFGGIFMDATMQRMKWITDWECVLGVNLINPHGFHYTLEGPRKRDWPPSQFYQYPWWNYYEEFSKYVSRVSHLLSGGRHVAKAGVIWPIHAMFATSTPQGHNAVADRIEADFAVLTDTLLRLHYDFDYLDEDMLAGAEMKDGAVRIRDEAYELIVVPPLSHIKLSTLEKLEKYVGDGGKVLGLILLPGQAFTDEKIEGLGLVDISSRVRDLFGVDPQDLLQNLRSFRGIDVLEKDHPGGGKASFLRSYALARWLPMRFQEELGAAGWPESEHFVIESEQEASRYFFARPGGAREEISTEVAAERQAVNYALQEALDGLIDPDIVIDNPEIFYLHRVNDGKDIYFLTNPTYVEQTAQVSLQGEIQPVLWDPSTGAEWSILVSRVGDGKTTFKVDLAPTGSAFILTKPAEDVRIVKTNLNLEKVDADHIAGYGNTAEGYLVVERGGKQIEMKAYFETALQPVELDGEWEFHTENANALVIGKWRAIQEDPGEEPRTYAAADADLSGWLPMVQGAWSYQLPAEPLAPYPIPVWYRMEFEVGALPSKLDLIVDGFAGSAWELYVNGERVTAAPVRSAIDSQMKAVDITSQVRLGTNHLAVRLVVGSPTGGILDLVKLMGDFSLEDMENGEYRIAAPRQTINPASWTEQGYPYYSGRATYRRQFDLPAGLLGESRVFLEPAVRDDVVEVIVNGRTAGIRLWAPYAVEVTEYLQPGDNVVELRVANTLINLLEGIARPSGLCGTPKLVPNHCFVFDGVA